MQMSTGACQVKEKVTGRGEGCGELETEHKLHPKWATSPQHQVTLQERKTAITRLPNYSRKCRVRFLCEIIH